MEMIGERLCQVLAPGQIREREPMARHTTFRVGGPADWFVEPDSADELGAVIKACREEQVPFYILGNGSNLLVGDKGYRGVMVALGKNFGTVSVEGTGLCAGAGALLSAAARQALGHGLSGLEFAAGIPGTVGGAVVMNAGAYGSEMCGVLDTVTVMAEDGQVKQVPARELELGYRTSSIPGKGYVVLEAKMALQPGDREAIRARMEELAAQRRGRQPLEFPSAGSTFKRPEGYFAGKLIQDAGLRGFAVGGAQVSEKHCGFVINRGNATAADILALCREVQARVKAQSGVGLEMEVKLLGEF